MYIYNFVFRKYLSRFRLDGKLLLKVWDDENFGLDNSALSRWKNSGFPSTTVVEKVHNQIYTMILEKFSREELFDCEKEIIESIEIQMPIGGSYLRETHNQNNLFTLLDFFYQNRIIFNENCTVSAYKLLQNQIRSINPMDPLKLEENKSELLELRKLALVERMHDLYIEATQSLGLLMRTYYFTTNDCGKIKQGIRYLNKAIKVAKESHSLFLSSLLKDLSTLYISQAHDGELKKNIKIGQTLLKEAAVALTPLHPKSEYSRIMCNLGVSYLVSSEVYDSKKFTSASISLFTELFDHGQVTKENPAYLQIVMGLFNSYLSYSRVTHELKYIDKVVNEIEAFISEYIFSEDPIALSNLYCNLANVLALKASILNDSSILKRALDYIYSGVSIIESCSQEFAVLQNKYIEGMIYLEDYKITRNTQSLEQAKIIISKLYNERESYITDSSFIESGYYSVMMFSAEVDKDLGLLNTVIEYVEKQIKCMSDGSDLAKAQGYQNLAEAYSIMYQLNGELNALEKSIECVNQSETFFALYEYPVINTELNLIKVKAYQEMNKQVTSLYSHQHIENELIRMFRVSKLHGQTAMMLEITRIESNIEKTYKTQ